MPINFTGLSSVQNRTIFTNNATIVKPPAYLLSGNDLVIIGPDEVYIDSGSFNESNVGFDLIISDPSVPGARNSGTFKILKVLNAKRLRLTDANFDTLNSSKYSSDICLLANALKRSFNNHIAADGVHPNNGVNFVTTGDANDINSARLLSIDIATKLVAHGQSGPQNYEDFSIENDVHYFADPDSQIDFAESSNLGSLYLFLNLVRTRFDAHRLNRFFHSKDDFQNQVKTSSIPGVLVSPVKPSHGGPIVGPYNWVLSDPRTGMVADSPSDVTVKVNNSLVEVEAVFGSVGAIVLEDVPPPASNVKITYSYIKNTPNVMESLNSWSYVLNEEKNLGLAGLPGHKYKQRSFLPSYQISSRLKSPYQPYRAEFRWKAYEYEYTATLNNPDTLLLNVPANSIAYPIYSELFREQTIRYNGVVLPDAAIDPWTFVGDGVVSLSSNFLIIEDPNSSYSSIPGPPFYYHPINLENQSIVNFVSRCFVPDTKDYVYDGVFTGVGFGINTGQKAILVGFLKDEARNLSTAYALARSLKRNFNSHLLETGVHAPNDTINSISLNDPTNKSNLIKLCNAFKSSYLSHINLGPDGVHRNIDIFDALYLPDLDINSAESEITAFLNSYRNSFNSHMTRDSIHYVTDTKNYVDLVKQVAFLNKDGLLSESKSWSSFAYDWSIESTYRVFVDPNGNASLYVNGNIDPSIRIPVSEQPNASIQNINFMSVNQVYFGSLDSASTNKSYWKLLRLNIIPVDALFVGSNKTIVYEVDSLPDEAESPWISIGNSGDSNIIKITPSLENRLQIDSMSHIMESESGQLGIVTGEYRGYIRIEPSLTPENVVDISFETQSVFGSFGIDNRSHCVSICDGDNAVIFSLLQLNPQPATVFSAIDPTLANLQTGDLAVFCFEDNSLKSFAFDPDPMNPIDAQFNAAAGADIASIEPNGILKITSISSGADAKLVVYGGSIFSKLGITEGTYIGDESKPEPKLSYTGLNLPENDSPSWGSVGNQPVSLVNRYLSIVDKSYSDFRYYIQNDPRVVSDVISINGDYVLDFRVKVESYVRGDMVDVITGTPLFLCGVFAAVDEGFTTNGTMSTYGRSLTVALAEDETSQKFVCVLSYNPGSNYYEYVDRIAFNWHDAKFHNFTVSTNKSSNLVAITIDSTVFKTFPYNGLQYGVDGPSVTFGSAAKQADNVEIKQSQSSTLWSNVSVMRNSNSKPENRYIGLYRGGDPLLRSSYYSYKHDWKNFTKYRIVRDPVVGVSVYTSGDLPVIDASFDVLSLPLESVDFLSKSVPSGKFIAFGSFSPYEITRSFWGGITYSIGRIAASKSAIKDNQTINYANVIASPGHLTTGVAHSHFGTGTYSGGTPETDFLANFGTSTNPTLLGDSTPIFEYSETLENQGGLKLVATPVNDFSSSELISAEGQQGFLDNDIENVVSSPDSQTVNQSRAAFLAKLVSVINKFNNHINKVTFGTLDVHIVSGSVDSVTIPASWSQAITSFNSLTNAYNSHRTRSGVHNRDDAVHEYTNLPAQALIDAIPKLNQFIEVFDGHIGSYVAHGMETPPLDSLPDYIALVNDLRIKFNAHLNNTSVHNSADLLNVIPDDYVATDLISAVDLANYLRSAYATHCSISGTSNVHVIADTSNQVTAASAPYSLPGLIALLDPSIPGTITYEFNAHRVSGPPGGPHTASTDPNGVTFHDPTVVEYVCRITEQVKTGLNSHVLNLNAHAIPDLKSFETRSAQYSRDFSSYNTQSILDLVNDLYINTLNHLERLPEHKTEDFYTRDITIIPPNTVTYPCVDLSQGLEMVLNLRDRLSTHFASAVGGTNLLAHMGIDSQDFALKSDLITSLESCITLSNELREALNNHLERKLSHLRTGGRVVGPRFAEIISAPAPETLRFKANSCFGIKVDGTEVRIKDISGVFSLEQLAQSINNAASLPPLSATTPIASVSVVDSRRYLKLRGLNIPFDSYPSLAEIEVFEERPKLITAIGNSGGKVKLTVMDHGLSSGDIVTVQNFLSDALRPDLNKRWSVTVIDVDQFELDGSTWTPVTFYGGEVAIFDSPFSSENYSPLVVQDVTDASPGVRITAINHGLFSNDAVTITGVEGIPYVNNNWVITRIDNDHFILNSSTFSGSYVQNTGRVIFNRTSVGFRSGDKNYGVKEHIYGPATDLESLILLSNAINITYNKHRVGDGVHILNDTVNTSSGIADSLDTAVALCNSVKAAFNSHRTEDGVHGNVALIRFTTPDETMKILYESLSVFEDHSGEKNLTSTFSDDGGLIVN